MDEGRQYVWNTTAHYGEENWKWIDIMMPGAGLQGRICNVYLHSKVAMAPPACTYSRILMNYFAKTRRVFRAPVPVV